MCAVQTLINCADNKKKSADKKFFIRADNPKLTALSMLIICTVYVIIVRIINVYCLC